jgi:RHS repeat-associated protein
VHTYDSQGRPVSTTQTLTDAAYTSEMAYDGWSRVVSQKYRRGTDPVKQFDLRYNDKGYLNWIERGGLKLWSVSKQDPANRPTEIALGNGLKQIQTYNASSARLTGDQVKTSADVLRLDQGYTYDSLGSVSQRTQYWDQNGFIEDFTYDDLNRLASSTVSGQATQSFTYYADGSLRSKTGVGSGDYVYPDPGVGAPRPHAVSSIPGFVSFSYDNNGNLLTAGNETVTWNSFDMPKLISKNGYRSGFVYGSEHQRVRQDRGDNVTIIYAGAQEVETQGTAVTVRTYWPMGIGFEVDSPGKPVQLVWAHKDRLGSPVALTAQDGTMLERLAYDAWGKRRSANGSSTADSIDGVTDHRGFTGHEMLDQLDLVHMNGRVYDPFTAKFLSGDPLIQDPMNGQNYNRYSYVLNNPTNLIDPTGFSCADVTGTKICAKTQEVFDNLMGMLGVKCSGGCSFSTAIGGKTNGAAEIKDANANNKPSGKSPQSGVASESANTNGGNGGRTAAPCAGQDNCTVGGIPTVVVRTPIREMQRSNDRFNEEFARTGCFSGVICIGPGAIGSVTTKTASSVLSKYLVYKGIDANGVVKYVGITSREAEKRFAEHLNSLNTGKELLQYRVVQGLEDLGKLEARVQEQIQINAHELEKNGGQLINKINSIAEKYWDELGIKK